MPDPLVLPLELWTWCVALAIDGREAGPLEFLAVSRRWENALLDTPSLWTQIYVQNGEDEAARISTFLRFSRGCPLHVDVMTALPEVDRLQLIANHMSRITTISIRPGLSDTITSRGMERWRQAAAYNMAMLSNGLTPAAVKSSSCFGISLREDGQLYYSIIFIHLTMKVTLANSNRKNHSSSAGLPVIASRRLWEKYITRCATVGD
jgi:hypothetical protein